MVLVLVVTAPVVVLRSQHTSAVELLQQAVVRADEVRDPPTDQPHERTPESIDHTPRRRRSTTQSNRVDPRIQAKCAISPTPPVPGNR